MIKRFLTLFLVILIGCSEPEPINTNTLRYQDGLFYTKENNKEYSGPVFSTTKLDRVYLEGKLKNGKRVGPYIFTEFNGEKKEGYFYDLNSISRNYSGFVFSEIYFTYDWGPELLYYTVKDGILNGEFKSRDDYQTILSGNYKNGLKEGEYFKIKRGIWTERESGTFVNDIKKGEYFISVSSNSHPPRLFERNKLSGKTKKTKTSHIEESGYFVDGFKDGEYQIIGTYCGDKETNKRRGLYYSDCENITKIVIEKGIYSQGEKNIIDTIF